MTDRQGLDKTQQVLDIWANATTLALSPAVLMVQSLELAIIVRAG